jgi:integrase
VASAQGLGRRPRHHRAGAIHRPQTYHLLGKVLAATVDAGMIAQSPCQRVPLPKIEREEMRFLSPAETRASRRTVGLPRAVVEELAAHLATPAPPDAFVFTAPKGGPLRVIAFRARIWRPTTRTAGLDGLRIHDLRHTAVAL